MDKMTEMVQDILDDYERAGVTEDRLEYSIDDIASGLEIDQKFAEAVQRALHEGDLSYEPF